MKLIVCFLMAGLLMMSCDRDNKNTKTDGYVITGTADGIYNGIRVYLKKGNDPRGRQETQDTAIVMDGKFKFEGKLDVPQMMFLSVNNINGVVPIIVENESINIKFNKDDIEASKVSGTKANEALAEYTTGFKKLLEKRNELNMQFAAVQNPNEQNDPETIEAVSQQLTESHNAVMNYPLEFLKTHTDNFFSLSLIDNILQGNPMNFEEIEELYAALDPDIKNSPYGKIVDQNMEIVRTKNANLAKLDIGKEAPNFTAPDPDGQPLSLYDIRGKVTIIDFWAAWCGPCRKENPNVVKVFEKYHDKGLEIISVSLDRKGQKERWLKAIADDNLNWHHVSHLNYFQDQVALQYNIQSIPATFILDAEGIIVAKNLRGQDLEDKIAEMLK